MLARRRRSDRNGAAAARGRALLLAGAAVALWLCGCGGDGSPAGTTAAGTQQPDVTSPAPTTPRSTPSSAESDAAAIRDVIRGVLVSGDPARACERDVTATYVATTYGDQKACEQAQLPGSAAKSVKVSGISINGDAATAVAVPSGGPSDGEKLKVSLVRDGSRWRVDALKSNVPVGP